MPACQSSKACSLQAFVVALVHPLASPSMFHLTTMLCHEAEGSQGNSIIDQGTCCEAGQARSDQVHPPYSVYVSITRI